MKKLPVSIANFSQMCEEGYVYVDKTQYLDGLVKNGKTYFLSRPRRFGKSLLISTLKELFQANKKVFKGLYIYDKWDWTKSYPVIHLDLGEISHETSEDLKTSLDFYLDTIGEEYSIALKAPNESMKFAELVKKLHKIFNQKVVVLIDEYDKPIIDNMDDLAIVDANSKVLCSFYEILKANDEYLRFVLITGVSKFSNTSIFSGFNNSDDITLDKKYSGICGYTHIELEEYFKEHIAELGEMESLNMNEVLNKINYWYDGYSWDGKTKVYNPFSILLLFNKMKFSNYWFETGTPTFLIEFLKKKNNLKPILQPILATKNGFSDFNLDNLNIVSLLFQTGYLTIIEKKTVNDAIEYTLDIPNHEVRESLMNKLVTAYTKLHEGELIELRNEVYECILNKDSHKLTEILEEIYKQIPYQLKGDNEGFYHSIFLIILYLFGIEPQGEVQTFAGRIDAVFKIKDQPIITEIKYSKVKSLDKLLNKSFNQIEKKKYYNKYKSKNLIYLALAFTNKDIACGFREN
ncbi:ATP-binding protein [Methanobrevibacter curvatus]|uniref:Putative AAA-ATPase n=1 Tax=Methanobrevibacter curvatus TaxID=49547 RepID=A0A162FF58_9EURY|nr:ATP-binding protein [Methanobrevibacter curvatus]KZX12185.1 putative AAA-ATPase [Methanobrevibacter curvatus]